MRWYALAFVACTASIALAQHAGCPPEAPAPMRPAGEPPAWIPPMDFPATFDEKPKPPESKLVPRASLTPDERAWIDRQLAERAANDGYLRGDDGHVGALRHLARAARASPGPRARVVDLSQTPLSRWEFVGFVREAGPFQATRVYRNANGSLLGLTEFDFRAAGGAVFEFEDLASARVGTHRASPGGVKGPSGCVVTTLGWHDGARQYSLQVAGPLPAQEQRRLLQEIAEAIARVPAAAN